MTTPTTTNDDDSFSSLDVDSIMNWFFSSPPHLHLLHQQHQQHSIPTITTPHYYLRRILQNDNGGGGAGSSDNTRGRTVLTVLYLSVLGLCFVVPIFYYLRLHCEERHARRLRDMEMIDFAALFATTTANNNNNNNNNSNSEEVIQSRAVRKKYREERRARIIQLLAPVRVVRTRKYPYYWNVGVWMELTQTVPFVASASFLKGAHQGSLPTTNIVVIIPNNETYIC
jgi:hypothetical protein